MALKQSEIRSEARGTLEDLSEESPLSIAESPSPNKNKSKTKNINYNDPQLVINILYTQYEIIHEVAAACNLRTSVDEEEDWDLWFIDGATIPALLGKMKNY